MTFMSTIEGLFETGASGRTTEQTSVACNSKLMKIHETESVFEIQNASLESGVHRRCFLRGW